MSENILEITNAVKKFQVDNEAVTALDGVSLCIQENEFISIVGASGCGKSTLLRLIMALEELTSGSIKIEGEEVRGQSEKIGVIFQEPRLFPWKNVEKNIEFVIPRTVPKTERKKIVEENINIVGLQDFKKAVPGQLSGGMQQRVGIARALAAKPDILLLDEPFGALDAFTRMTMQNELLRIWKEEKNTMILVTHDVDEAIFLSTRVVVMTPHPGKIKSIISIKLDGERDRSSYSFLEYRKKIMMELLGHRDRQIEYNI